RGKMNGKQIKSVMAEGLLYIDDNGDEVNIDFSACYNNYLQKAISPQYIQRMKELNPTFRWDDEGVRQYIEKRTAWREVAKRNVLGPSWGDGPYIEFYTEPPTRFNFSTADEYRKVSSEIERHGWRTFDLS